MIEFILKHKKSVVITFIVLAIASGVVQYCIQTNYDMFDYRSDDTPSTAATDLRKEELEDNETNTRVMIKDVGIQEALEYKEKLEDIGAVSGVMWLDDVMDVTTPIEMED